MPPSWPQVALLPQLPAGDKPGQVNPARLLHCCRTEPHLPQAFCGKERKTRVPAGSSNLLEAPAEMEAAVTPSCCPRAPHQAGLAGSVVLSLPAQGSVRCWPVSAAPCFLHVRARPQPALAPAHCWAALEGTWGESSNRNENTKVYRIGQKQQQPRPDLTNQQPETRNCPVGETLRGPPQTGSALNGRRGCGKEREEVPSLVKERPAGRGGMATVAEASQDVRRSPPGSAPSPTQ